jgi:hypothetical protein
LSAGVSAAPHFGQYFAAENPREFIVVFPQELQNFVIFKFKNAMRMVAGININNDGSDIPISQTKIINKALMI